MDFEFLTSSYKRYKADTTAFCTWLSAQAAICGYGRKESTGPVANDAPSTASLADRLREKAAKKATKRLAKASISDTIQSNPSPVTRITTRDLLTQAKTVAIGKVKMPAVIITVLKRAIRARKRCSEMFQKSPSQDAESTARHVHFISILEQAMDILEPCIEKESLDITGKERGRYDLLKDVLHSEMSDDENLLGTSNDSSTDPYVAPTARNAARESLQVELEEDDSDRGFAAFCFFEDMRCMEEYIKTVWEEYKEGKIDVLTASFITNAAIDIIRTQEIEASEVVMPGHHLCYGELVMRTLGGAMEPGFATVICEALAQKQARGEDTTITDKEYREMAEKLEKRESNVTYQLPDPAADLFSEERQKQRIEEGYNAHSNMQSNGDIDTFLYRNIGITQTKNYECWDGKSVKWNEGPSNGRITSIAWDFDSQKTDLRDVPNWKEVLTDDYILTEMASEILLNNYYRMDPYAGEARGLSRLGNPVQGLSPDLISDRYVEEVLALPRGERVNRRHISACFIFSSAVMLDIHRILGDRSGEVVKELAVSMDKAEASLRVKWQDGSEDFSREDQNEDMALAAKILTRARNSANRKSIYTGELLDRLGSQMLERISRSIDRSVTRHWDHEKKMAMHDVRGTLAQEIRVYPDFPYDSEHMQKLWDDWSKTRRSENFPRIVMIEVNDPSTGARIIDSETGLPAKIPSERHQYLISEEPFFFVHNPANCGIRLLELGLNMEEAGLAITNHHFSILWLAHLYNAARQLGTLEIPWPEMDRVIELHLSTMFRGKLPEEGEQFFKRFGLAQGVKPSNWKTHERAKHRHHEFKLDQASREGPMKLPPTKISAILRKLRDKDDPLTLQQSLWRINSLIEGDPKEKKRGQAQLTPIQLLDRVRKIFPTFVRDMQIDYLELNRKCSELLWRIRMSILVELKIDHNVHGKPADKCAEPGFCQMAFSIFTEVSVLHGRKGLKDRAGPELKVVGNVLRKFLEAK